MVVDSERALIIKNLLSEITLAVKALKKENRLAKLISLIDSSIISEPIANLPAAIAEFKVSLTTAEDNEAYDSFVFIVSRVMIMNGLDSIKSTMASLSTDLQSDDFLNPVVIPNNSAADIVLTLFRLFNTEIIDPSKINEPS